MKKKHLIILIFFSIAMLILAMSVIIRIKHQMVPTAVWQDGSLKIKTWSDGTFVVTHLVSSQNENMYFAELPSPLIIHQAQSKNISSYEWSTLRWFDMSGKERSIPSGELPKTSIVYYRAEISQ